MSKIEEALDSIEHELRIGRLGDIVSGRVRDILTALSVSAAVAGAEAMREAAAVCCEQRGAIKVTLSLANTSTAEDFCAAAIRALPCSPRPEEPGK